MTVTKEKCLQNKRCTGHNLLPALFKVYLDSALKKSKHQGIQLSAFSKYSFISYQSGNFIIQETKYLQRAVLIQQVSY